VLLTFAVHGMARSVGFYQSFGFELFYGGERTAFSSLKASDALFNLSASPGYEGQVVGGESFSESTTWKRSTGLCNHKD
jgi:hypothetical protein